MNDHPVSVHIGLMKAASTTLQSVAGQTEGLFFPPTHEVFAWQSRAKRDGFDEALPDFLKFAEAARQFDGPALISQESLSTLSGNRLAKVLAEQLPGCRVFIISRNPVDWVMSSYRKSVRHGYAGTIADFVDERRDRLVRKFEFDRIARTYGKYGIPVEFIPFELLVEDQGRFFALIERIVGMPLATSKLQASANITPPHEVLEMLRAANALLQAIFAKHDRKAALEYKKTLYRWTTNLNALDADTVARLMPHFNIMSKEEAREELEAHGGTLLAAAAPRMSVLGTIPEYEPFLRQYGLRQSNRLLPARRDAVAVASPE